MKSQGDYAKEHIEARRGPERFAERKAARGRSRVETAARAEFETHAGRPIGDAEWEATKARLVELARIVHRWHRDKMTAVPPESVATAQRLADAA